jgi:hypothetical protein
MDPLCNHANRPKNKHRWCNSFMRFTFNLDRIKICTVLYNDVKQTVFCASILCCVLKCKKSLTWGGGHKYKVQTLTPSLTHVENRLPYFPQAVSLVPSPRSHPFQPPHISTHNFTEGRWHWQIRGLLYLIQRWLQLQLQVMSFDQPGPKYSLFF